MLRLRFGSLLIPMVLAVGLPSTVWSDEAPEEVTEPQPGEQRRIDIGSGVFVMFVWIPAGEFVMGSPEDELGRYERESPQTRVTHSKGFWMSETPVTQAQYTILMNENPSDPRGLPFPVVNVDFDDALRFCDVLSRHSGLFVTLPTEAQWEYAARAGTTTPFHFGTSITTQMANYNGLFVYGDGEEGLHRRSPSSVRIFPANDFGLYDMHGNVNEWCLDYFGEYPGGEQADWFQRIPNAEFTRVIRGGSWESRPEFTRSAARLWARETTRAPVIGFRVVATEHPPLHGPEAPMTVEEMWETRPPRPPR